MWSDEGDTVYTRQLDMTWTAAGCGQTRVTRCIHGSRCSGQVAPYVLRHTVHIDMLWMRTRQ